MYIYIYIYKTYVYLCIYIKVHYVVLFRCLGFQSQNVKKSQHKINKPHMLIH